MATTDDDADDRRDLPYDPRTGEAGHYVTIAFWNLYANDTTTTGGEVVADHAEPGRVIAFDDDTRDRILEVRPSGLVISRNDENHGLRVGHLQDVVAICTIDDSEGGEMDG